MNNYTILAFGVLFDFTGNDKFVSTCQPVNQLINEPWFQTVLREETYDVDVVVVAGHTPLRNSTGFEYDLVLSAIRAHLPTTPVQFFGGHSHIRDFRKYDNLAHGIESGRYLETLGWVNMDLDPFHVGRRYIDNNLGGYRFHAEIKDEDEFATDEGKVITEDIRKKVIVLLLLADHRGNNKGYGNFWDVCREIIILIELRILPLAISSLLSPRMCFQN
jgi:hypothetical protein